MRRVVDDTLVADRIFIAFCSFMQHTADIHNDPLNNIYDRLENVQDKLAQSGRAQDIFKYMKERKMFDRKKQNKMDTKAIKKVRGSIRRVLVDLEDMR